MNTERRMRDVLAELELEYDFRDFTMESFVRWLESRINREIRFKSWPMPPGLFGVWLSDAEEPVEYIFYHDAIPEMQQAHIQLHELSHILCGHPTARLTRAEMGELLSQAMKQPAVLSQATLRAPADSEIEAEAELLASLIQHRVIRNKRMAELAVRISSDGELAEHFKSLGLV